MLSMLFVNKNINYVNKHFINITRTSRSINLMDILNLNSNESFKYIQKPLSASAGM